MEQIDWAALFRCQTCGEQLKNGRQLLDHAIAHMDPATAGRIERETGEPVKDFLVFCIQQGMRVSGFAPDDPFVNQAIAFWQRLKDDPHAEPPPLTSEEPDPDVWGEMPGGES